MAWIVSEVLTVLWPVYEELLGSACSLVGGCACSVNASIQWAPGDFPLPFLHIPPPPQTPLFAKHQGMHGVAEGWRQGLVCLPCASRGRDHPASLIPQHIPLWAVEQSCPTANLSHLPCDKPPPQHFGYPPTYAPSLPHGDPHWCLPALSPSSSASLDQSWRDKVAQRGCLNWLWKHGWFGIVNIISMKVNRDGTYGPLVSSMLIMVRCCITHSGLDSALWQVALSSRCPPC